MKLSKTNWENLLLEQREGSAVRVSVGALSTIRLINMFIMILILKYADLYLILFIILLLVMLLPIKILVMMMLVMLVLVILIMVMPMLVMPTFQLVAAGFCAASLSLLILLSMPHLSQMPVT